MPVRIWSGFDDRAYHRPLSATDRQSLGDVAQKHFPVGLSSIVGASLDALDSHDRSTRNKRIAMDPDEPVWKLFFERN
jgi:hypothetical protein